MSTSRNKYKRNFDFDKDQKRSFDFTKDEGEIETSISDPSNPWWTFLKKWWWVWLLLLALVICVIVCLKVATNTNDKNKVPDVSTTLEDDAARKDNRNVSEESMTIVDSAISKVSATPSDEIQETEIVEEMNSESRKQVSVVPSITEGVTPVEDLSISNDVETEAMKVIRGDYGVGQERKNKLGTQYRPIQNRVNQLKREGVF